MSPRQQEPTVLSAFVAHPYRSLVLAFGTWKAFLLGVAALAAAVGPAYDTSGGLVDPEALLHGSPETDSLSVRLTSWDAIYYVQTARRGYVYEQEWAFGAGLPLMVTAVHKAIVRLSPSAEISVATVAVIVAHVFHLLAVLLLYRLGRVVWPRTSNVALVSALLHIVSPAGLFLSAPYSESACACLSFAGYRIFAAGLKQDPSPESPCFSGDVLRLSAGLLFGLATAFRSNGILNGLPFAYEALVGVVSFGGKPTLSVFRRLAFLGLGGLLVAAGYVIPQAVAYTQFCTAPSGIAGEDLRPWCKQALPSIYTFVQERYWNCGFFRYWTLSNLPLFLLAAPVLYILIRSSLDTYTDVITQKSVAPTYAKSSVVAISMDGPEPKVVPLLLCMATAQLLLASLAITSYHVQIITRISSGYAVWYWWIARGLSGGPRVGLASGIVIFMIMYASIQGVLFASFLPPA